MNDEYKNTPSGEDQPSKPYSTRTRVLAFIGALAVLALSIGFAWSIATGGIFWF